MVDNIRKGQHGKAPPFILSTFYWPAPMATYPANLTIRNRSNCQLGFYLNGPSSRQLGVAPNQSETLYLTEGRYEFGVDTNLCAGEVPRLYGEDTFTAGRAYTFTIRDSDLEKVGDFIVSNETNGPLNVNVGNVRRSVTAGATTFRLPEGTHQVTVETRCGTLTQEIRVTQGWRHRIRYFCRTSRRDSAKGFGRLGFRSGPGATR